MATLTKVEKGLASQVRLFNGDRLDRNFSSTKKGVGLATALWPHLRLCNYEEFDKIGCADSASVSIMDDLNEAICLRFSEENSRKSGGI